MNRDYECSSFPTDVSRSQARVPAPISFPMAESDLFDFGSLNIGNQNALTNDDRAVSSLYRGSCSPDHHRLSLAQLSITGDFVTTSPRSPKRKHGERKIRRLKSPFKIMSNRTTGRSTEGSVEFSDHAVASLSPDSSSTLSTKSRLDSHLHGDESSLADPRDISALPSLPLESLSLSFSVIEDDCISDVSIDYSDLRRSHPTHPPSTSTATEHAACLSKTADYPVREPESAPASSISSSKDHEDDTVRKVGNLKDPGTIMVEVESGGFVPLIGSKDTLEDYRRGSVIDQTCMGCNEFLLCSDRSTMVVCPVCRFISPVMAKTGGFERFLGLGLTVNLIEAELRSSSGITVN